MNEFISKFFLIIINMNNDFEMNIFVIIIIRKYIFKNSSIKFFFNIFDYIKRWEKILNKFFEDYLYSWYEYFEFYIQHSTIIYFKNCKILIHFKDNIIHLKDRIKSFKIITIFRLLSMFSSINLQFLR